MTYLMSRRRQRGHESSCARELLAAIDHGSAASPHSRRSSQANKSSHTVGTADSTMVLDHSGASWGSPDNSLGSDRASQRQRHLQNQLLQRHLRKNQNKQQPLHTPYPFQRKHDKNSVYPPPPPPPPLSHDDASDGSFDSSISTPPPVGTSLSARLVVDDNSLSSIDLAPSPTDNETRDAQVVCRQPKPWGLLKQVQVPCKVGNQASTTIVDSPPSSSLHKSTATDLDEKSDFTSAPTEVATNKGADTVRRRIMQIEQTQIPSRRVRSDPAHFVGAKTNPNSLLSVSTEGSNGSRGCFSPPGPFLSQGKLGKHMEHQALEAARSRNLLSMDSSSVQSHSMSSSMGVEINAQTSDGFKFELQALGDHRQRMSLSRQKRTFHRSPALPTLPAPQGKESREIEQNDSTDPIFCPVSPGYSSKASFGSDYVSRGEFHESLSSSPQDKGKKSRPSPMSSLQVQPIFENDDRRRESSGSFKVLEETMPKLPFKATSTVADANAKSSFASARALFEAPTRSIVKPSLSAGREQAKPIEKSQKCSQSHGSASVHDKIKMSPEAKTAGSRYGHAVHRLNRSWSVRNDEPSLEHSDNCATPPVFDRDEIESSINRSTFNKSVFEKEKDAFGKGTRTVASLLELDLEDSEEGSSRADVKSVRSNFETDREAREDDSVSVKSRKEQFEESPASELKRTNGSIRDIVSLFEPRKPPKSSKFANCSNSNLKNAFTKFQGTTSQLRSQKVPEHDKTSISISTRTPTASNVARRINELSGPKESEGEEAGHDLHEKPLSRPRPELAQATNLSRPIQGFNMNECTTEQESANDAPRTSKPTLSFKEARMVFTERAMRANATSVIVAPKLASKQASRLVVAERKKNFDTKASFQSNFDSNEPKRDHQWRTSTQKTKNCQASSADDEPGYRVDSPPVRKSVSPPPLLTPVKQSKEEAMDSQHEERFISTHSFKKSPLPEEPVVMHSTVLSAKKSIVSPVPVRAQTLSQAHIHGMNKQISLIKEEEKEEDEEQPRTATTGFQGEYKRDEMNFQSFASNGAMRRVRPRTQQQPLPIKEPTVKAAVSCDASSVSDGVTLDVSVADVSCLTTPTALLSGGNDLRARQDTQSVNSDKGMDLLDSEARRSEASSSQTSEAAAPLIAKIMKLKPMSDDVSSDSFFVARAQIASHWGATSGWGDIPELVPRPVQQDATDRSISDSISAGWDVTKVETSFPVTIPVASSSDFESPWNLFPSAESPVFVYETHSNASLGFCRSKTPTRGNSSRLVKNTAHRRDTEQSPVESIRTFYHTRIPQPKTISPPTLPRTINFFEKTHPKRKCGPTISQEESPLLAETCPSRVTATNRGDLRSQARETRFGAQHAVLLSRLRKLKEARLKRSVSRYCSSTSTKYIPPDRNAIIDDGSASTRSSTRFGGNTFFAALEVD